jgi:hypothetical protein
MNFGKAISKEDKLNLANKFCGCSVHFIYQTSFIFDKVFFLLGKKVININFFHLNY